jgi:phosphohistidine phosphatase
MLTLSLLRHAKSSWEDRRLDDFDRPLNERGVRDAAAMGRWIAAHKLVPDRVVCSTAARTEATFALARKTWPGGSDLAVVRRKSLYLATPAALLAVVYATGPGVRHLMLIGHSPGLEELANRLISAGSRENREALAAKFPTAALAVITFPCARWSDIAPGHGRLAYFMTPKRLPE